MRKIAICLSVAWLSRATRAVLADELFVIVWKITGPVYTCYAVGSRVGKSVRVDLTVQRVHMEA